jgi:hypothetical protein
MPDDLPPPRRLASASTVTSESPRAKTMANDERNFTCFSDKKEWIRPTQCEHCSQAGASKGITGLSEMCNLVDLFIRVKSNLLI